MMKTSTEQLLEGNHLWFSLKIILRSIEIFYFYWKSVYNAFRLKNYCSCIINRSCCIVSPAIVFDPGDCVFTKHREKPIQSLLRGFMFFYVTSFKLSHTNNLCFTISLKVLDEDVLFQNIYFKLYNCTEKSLLCLW